jgi:hypothetical protein
MASASVRQPTVVLTSTVPQPCGGKIGKPQREYIVEPREIPVPAPARRENEQPLPAAPAEPVQIPERRAA